MLKHQMFIAAALFTGVAIGYFLKSDSPKAESNGDAGYVAASKIDNQGESASLKALRTRIAELEAELAKKSEEKSEPRHDEPRREEFRPRNMRENMEKFAKENPKMFAQVTNAIARGRQRRLERTNAKLDFLSSIDTSTMSSAQRKSHGRYQELLVKREELEDKMHNLDLADDEREELFREMRDINHEMRRTAQTERQTLLDQTAKALGFSDDDATTVGATLNDIIDATEQGRDMQPPPPPEGGTPGGAPAGPQGNR